MLDSCNCALFLEIVFPTKLLEIANLAVGQSVILPCGCQSAAFRRLGSRFREEVFQLLNDIRLIGLEPMTPRLSSACSNQLSYSRMLDLLGTMY